MPLVFWLYGDQCVQELVGLVFCDNVCVCVCVLLSESWKKIINPCTQYARHFIYKQITENTKSEYISVGKVTTGSPTTHLSSRWSS